MSKCLFCKKEGPFKTKEHIIPESLGNDTDILVDIICEECQNYFSREVEKPALEKTNIAFWRTYLGTPTKKKHLPSVNLDPPAPGALVSLHPATDTGIGFTSHKDGTVSIDGENPMFMKKLVSKDQGKYIMVLTPWHLSILGRFLGKIGLEYVAQFNLEDAFSVRYDNIRSFVRCGSLKHLWPIYWGEYGSLYDLKGPINYEGSDRIQEIECYKFNLGEMIKTSDKVFAFSIGTDLMVICLTNGLPYQDLENCVVGVKLSCVYYADGTW
jgi:hypothetical protein